MADFCNRNPITYPNFPPHINFSNSERDDIMTQIVDLLLKSGLPNMNKNIACGIAGNIKSESSFNYTAIGDSGSSYGLCQWHDPNRMTKLFEFCEKNGYPKDSVEGQVKFLIEELKTTMKSAYNSVSEGSVRNDVSKVAEEFCLNFEKPAHKETECPKRATNAIYVLRKYNQLKNQKS